MPVEIDQWEQIMKNSLKPGNFIVANPGIEKVMGQNGAPGFAEAIERNLSLAPFAFTTSKQVEPSDFINYPIGNVLKDLFKEIAPKLLRFPSSTRNPLEMKGQKGWSELTDPVSQLIPETVAPLGPISPDTRQRKLVPSRRGVKGISSHLNLIVDCSISMKDSDNYATIEKDTRIMQAGGRFSARFVAALLIEQAKKLGDSFSVFTFGGESPVTTLTKGASRDYKGVVEYLLTEDEQFLDADGNVDTMAAPFMPSNNTPLQKGIAACCSTMIANRDKIKGALTICILDGDPNGNDNNITQPYIQRGRSEIANHIFAQTGAATQLITSWDYDNYGTPSAVSKSDAWNPSGNPMMWLNEERLRREFGPVLYVIVGSGDDEANVQQLAQSFNAALMNYYTGGNWGIIQRSRTNREGKVEFETEIALGSDTRLNAPSPGSWSPWTRVGQTPPAGWGPGLNTINGASPGSWIAPSIRGPTQGCSNSFTISTGTIGISTFGGALLNMARAGKGGQLQKSCFTKRK